MINPKDVSGIILAGGQSNRMGGHDKGWVQLNGKPLIYHVLERLTPQVSDIVISANRNLLDYKSLGYPVIEDENSLLGPLEGMATCLNQITTRYALVVPVDAPYIPSDLVAQLSVKLPAPLILCRDNDRLQPLCGLYQRELWRSMRDFLDQGDRKLMLWCQQQSPRVVNLSQKQALNNINTPEDLAKLEQHS